MVEKNFVDYSIYGKCLEITDGILKLIVTCNVGPRIVYFGKVNGFNFLFNDVNDDISSKGIYFDTNFKKGEAWHLYGGHRLWKSPEDFETYAPDNYPVEVTMLDNGALFTAPTEKLTGIQKALKIKLKEGKVKITHSFVNKSDATISASMWALTVMDKGGKAFIPLSEEDTGWLPNRNIVLWSYTDINDPRLKFMQNGIRIAQDEKATTNIKIGTQSNLGCAYYMLNGELFKKSFEVVANGNYPDYSSNLECYTSPLILEIETLSEFDTIIPEQKTKYREYWEIVDKDSAEYKEINAKINA